MKRPAFISGLTTDSTTLSATLGGIGLSSFVLLALPAQLISLPAQAHGQLAQAHSQLERQPSLHEVVITASPLHTNPEMSAQAVSSLSGDELRRQASANLGETLAYQPGISNASFGPGVGVPVIRGQSANRVKILENQLDTLDASGLSNDHAISIEPLLATRIEILRGPATLRYGSGAIGGVINIIDNSIPAAVPERTEGALELRHNHVSDNDVAVFRVDGGSGSVAWHLDGLYRDSNDVRIPGWAMRDPEHDDDNSHGYIANTGARARNGTAGLSWIGDKGHIGVSVSTLKSRYGIPAGGHQHPPHDHDHDHDHDHHHDDHAGHDHHHDSVYVTMRQDRYTLNGSYRFDGAWLEALDTRLVYSDYQHTEFEGGQRGTTFTSEGFELRTELTHQDAGNWHGAFGAQIGVRDYTAVGAEAFIPASDIHSYGLFWIEELDLDQLVVQLGARLEHQSIEPKVSGGPRKRTHNPFSVSGSVIWHLDDHHSLNFVTGRSQRAPSVEELFSNGEHLATASYDIGNERLDVETSHNIELGYQYQGAWRLEVRAYYNEIDDFIFRANTGEEHPHAHLPIYQHQQERARFHGAEAELELPLHDRLSFSVFGDVVRARLKNSGDVPYVPPARMGAALNQEWGQLDAELQVVHAFSQRRAGVFEEGTDGYTRVDLSLGYRIPVDDREVLLFVNGRNLTNEAIRNATSHLRDVAPEPGRSIEAGVRFTF